MSAKQFLEKLQALISTLDNWESMTDDSLLAGLRNSAQDVSDKYDEIMTKDRNLKLGIVGRVKAGKSSFLNALLFDGEDLLPKAATPMTAALTHIKYAPSVEEQEVIVHYYTCEEWENIKRKSKEYEENLTRNVENCLQDWLDSPRRKLLGKRPNEAEIQQKRQDLRRELEPSQREDLKVCNELVKMAQAISLRHEQLERTDGDTYRLVFNADDLQHQLKEFISAEGKYTPMVKYLDLTVHHSGLQGFEVTDTPGLNDPITSRVDVTNKYLKECDAVLMLSPVGRFLDKQDFDLVKQLNGSAVKEIYIIGTKMDSGLLQYSNCNDLQKAYTGSRANYIKQLRHFIEELAKEKALPKKFEEMQANPQARFVSSLMLSIAQKLRQSRPLSREEEHILQRFAKTYPGYDKKYLIEPDDFEDFAGFSGVRKHIYEPVKAKKEEIIAERIAKFESSQAGDICNRLDLLCTVAMERKNVMEKNDVSSLSERLNLMQQKLQSARIDVRNIFSGISINCQKTLMNLKINLRENISNFQQIKEEKEVKTREWSDGIIFKDYHYETYTVTKAATTDATANIEKYVVEATKLVTSAMDDMLNKYSIEHDLQKAIFETFDSTSIDSSKADILGPVQALVAELTIPEIDFKFAEEAKKKISNNFSNPVRDDEIFKLKEIQEEQLQIVYDNISKNIDKIVDNIKSVLNKQGATFIDNVCNKITDTYKTLENQLKDKEKNIQRYNDAIASMTAFKFDFANLGN